MKQDELLRYANCSLCKRPIGHTSLPLFWRVTVERFGVDMNAVRRQDHLTAFMGGHAAISHAMGPDEEMAKPMMEKLTLSVCEKCALEQHLIAGLAEFEGVKS